jgi:hypothetical protein
MPKRRTLILSQEEQAQLEEIRDHDRRAYLRERAAALLKIAQGRSPHWVACFGLLKPREPDTVYGWLNDYQRTRQIQPRRPCRGRFSPGGRGVPEPTPASSPRP